MKKLKYWFVFLVFTHTLIQTTQKHLLILDTSGNSQASYSQLQALAESVGFKCSFANFYNPPATLTTFDAVFLFLDPYFFQNTGAKKKSPLTLKILSLITTFAQKQDGLLGLFFPGKLPQTEQNQRALCGFFNQIKIDTQLCTIIKDLGPCIFSTDEQRSTTYRTSLVPAWYKIANKKKSSHCRISSLKELDHQPLTLPAGIKNTYLKSILPLCLYVKPKNLTALIIGTESSFKGIELEENMFFAPYDWPDRKKLLSTLQDTLLQLHTSLITKTPPNKSTIHLTLPPSVLPQELSASKKSTLHPFFHKKISCAWMEIEPLENNWKQAVEYVKKSNINLLWTSFNPEWYLSKNAVRSKKEYEKVTLGIEKFTQELAQAYKQQEQPALFVGFDLTNNYNKTPVTHPVVTVYGKQYSKIPSPLDKEHFWKEEFIDPLKQFIQDWKQHADQKIPIGGIFFDFEMYHAPEQAAVYTNLMDFSDLAWNLYVQTVKKQELYTLKTINERVTFLFEKRLFKDYFETLERAAQQLGINLKQSIKQELPHALIGAYIPSLLDSWFYRGLFAGLGTKEEPLILATFNLNYSSHKPWFEQHNIHAIHLPVVMLSHITDKNHPSTTLSNYHHGVWFNRFSRLFQPCKKSDWYHLECTESNLSLVIKKLKEYI